MKKFLLLTIVCVNSLLMSQKTMAAVYEADHLKITTNGKIVTIESSDASALWAFLTYTTDTNLKTQVTNAIKAATGEGSEIVFSGQFSGDDLKALSNNQCCVAETVNMENATFKKHIELANAMGAYKINANSETSPANTQLNTSASNQGINLQEGDLGVYNNTFYKYNGTSWDTTTEPFFVSEQRLNDLVRTGYPATGNYAKAYVDGVLTTFQCKTDPANNDYDEKWRPLASEAGYDEMTFSYWGANVKYATTSKYVGANDTWPTNLTQDCSNLAELTLSSGNVSTLGGYKPSTKVTIGNKVVELGQQLFQNAQFQTVEFESGGTDPLVFRTECFQRSAITEVNIPARATMIETMAFSSCNSLTKVTFDPPTSSQTDLQPLVIKYQAFNESKAIRDVYVNVSPSEKYLVCEYNAFPFEVQDAQSQASGYNSMAQLHFDEDDKEYYKGEWKEGVGLTHDDLMAIRGESVSSSTTSLNITALDETLLVNQTTNVPVTYTESDNSGYTMGYKLSQRPANGWQQFAKTGNEIPIINNYIRSFSSTSPLEVPMYGSHCLVKVYRVWKFEDGYTDGANVTEANSTTEKKAYAKILTEEYIPGGTGLILFATPVDGKQLIFNFETYTGGDTRQYPFTGAGKTLENANENEDNLLMGNPATDIELYPTTSENGSVAFRNFGFRASDKKFLRAQPGSKLKKGHAYLKLNPDLFHWKNEKEGVSSQSEDGNVTTTTTTSAKISFIYDFEESEFPEGVATVIRKAIEEAELGEGDYYTLQGVKVSKPTVKGVYIHNGKKIFIK